MSTSRYTEDELRAYFADPQRRRPGGNGASGQPPGGGPTPPPRYTGYRAWLHGRLGGDPKKTEAAFVLSVLLGVLFAGALVILLMLAVLSTDLPATKDLENPNLDLATVAYTADGVELARFGWENRSFVPMDSISNHVIEALVATEDHRFYDHWGVDLFRTFSAIAQTLLGDVQGGSTITQQLARNLYNEQIGFDRSPTRKLKEMVTAIQLERRYTKREIIEMYLNTVPFRYNAYGIEAAARTYFGKSAKELDVLESAALVGMLKANTRYDPYRNPENSRRRRNVVMAQMVKHDFLEPSVLETYRDSLTTVTFRSSDVTQSFAPYFAEYVRNWLGEWGEQYEGDIDVYGDGLIVHTTLDSRFQTMAQQAVERQMDGLQAVVDCEWSRPSGYMLGQSLDPYLKARERGECPPFAYFWERNADLRDQFIRESERYRRLRREGAEPEAALTQLRADEAFMDSLKTVKTRLEAGLLSIDPHTGHVKAWVGGRDLATDWYDHVATAKRQPGSTFKPFVYTAAVDNGYAPSYMLADTFFVYTDPVTGQQWSPRNSGSGATGRYMTLREGLARSLNTITGQVITELVNPEAVARYARHMGIRSELDKVPALALGTSDVSLYELTTAYSTLANGGLYHEPVVVTSIEDKSGNILYENTPEVHEALSENVAYTVVDMMRDVIDQPYGTGVRIRFQFGLDGYDFAGKTGTTQESADGWFMLMHPNLVTGAWVGFNDRRVTFRSNWWGQGAHNALFVVGDYVRELTRLDDAPLARSARFPEPEAYRLPTAPQDLERERIRNDATRRDRVDW